MGSSNESNEKIVFGRRELLAAAAGASVAGAALSKATAGEKVAAKNSLIARENSLPGTADWQTTYVRTDDGNPSRSRRVEGYCSATSVAAGEGIEIFLSADPAADVSIDLYRMGYYGGAGGRWMTRLGPLPVSPQPTPAFGKNRLRECQWKPAAQFVIPRDWLSGVYLGKLSCKQHRYQSYIIFIVRDDRRADLLFQCSDNTWQAYNMWPGESSLYSNGGKGWSLNGTTRVSFDRPYGKYPQIIDQPLSVGSGDFLCWEFPLCYWLEQEGYDVSYCSNVDTHARPETLKRTKTLLSVGHDEYWSLEMFQNVKKAVADGLNVAFLSGNTCCFVAPLVSSTDGRPHRVFHRAGRYGGLLEAEKKSMGPFDLEGPNENTLIGARTIDPFNGSGDWIVRKANHWLFEGTGMKNGDAIAGLVGWEFHGDPAKIPGLEVVASGTATNAGDRSGEWTATIYPGPKGNWVFNASTIFWSMGLSDPPGLLTPTSHFGRPHGPDERVQKITRNFLRRCVF